MADLFISYSRRDKDFVVSLTDALSTRGHECWVDWEDVEPSDAWRQSMRDGIDAADALVFVMSPKSLASKACREELDHASAEHKRLIGVLRDDVEGLEVPSAIENVNWVYLRATDDFGVGLSALERALDLDLDLVRIHTRVLTRAKAWELGGRRPTPLLRGEELRAAEGWLARAAAGVEPQPTELQAAFVYESRRRSSRRQRLTVSGSLAVALVAIGLATFALIQRAQARHEARIARSRELAARAAPELANNPEHAIALAAQGLRIEPTAQARHTLSSALEASRLRVDLRQSSPVGAVTFSPDGTLLAVGSDDGAVRLWRVRDRRVLWSQGRGEPAVTSVSFPAVEICSRSHGAAALPARDAQSRCYVYPPVPSVEWSKGLSATRVVCLRSFSA